MQRLTLNLKGIFLKCPKKFYHIHMVETYTKDLKESVYHGAVVSALAVGYTMLKYLKINKDEPSISRKV